MAVLKPCSHCHWLKPENNNVQECKMFPTKDTVAVILFQFLRYSLAKYKKHHMISVQHLPQKSLLLLYHHYCEMPF